MDAPVHFHNPRYGACLCLVLALCALATGVRNAAAQVVVTSPCGPGMCALRAPDAGTACVVGTEPACGCIASVPGSACIECNQAGYISGTSCVCDVPHALQDPNRIVNDVAMPCTAVASLQTTGDYSVVSSNAPCACWNSSKPELGCYEACNTDVLFGEKNPQTCCRCCNTGYGPQPGVGDDSQVSLSQKVSCRGYGATDPQLSWTNTTWATGWQTCAGHGAWNYTQVGCECDAGWTLVPNGFDGFFEQPQYVCSQCAPFAGPDAHSVEYEGLQPVVSSATSQSFCSLIYTPRVGLNANGAPAMCSGNGVDLGNGQGCACFNSSVAGYWTLTQVSDLVLQYQLDRTRRAHVIQTLTNATAWTCAACNTNYTSSTVDEGCL